MLKQITKIKKKLCCIILPLLFLPLKAHINDEIAVRTRLNILEDGMLYRFCIDLGTVIGVYYLDRLDPDKNGIDKTHIDKFAEAVLATQNFLLNDKKLNFSLKEFEFVRFENDLTNFGSIILLFDCKIKFENEKTYTLNFSNNFNEMEPTISLQINYPKRAAFYTLSENRNEILQDSCRLTFVKSLSPQMNAQGRIELSAVSERQKKQKASINDFEKQTTLKAAFLINQIKKGEYKIWILFVSAAFVGFLHAFSPGHGKSLVGAWLIAHHGKFAHAVGLGAVIAFTHTASIYFFAFIVNTLSSLFVPTKIIPFMSILTGIIICITGVQTVIRRFHGSYTDHAHILPNLKILQRTKVNIIADGSATDSAELVAMAVDNTCVQRKLKEGGASGINIYCPGCEGHAGFSRTAAQRQSSLLLGMAIETGAVEGMLCSRFLSKKLQNLIDKTSSLIFADRIETEENAVSFLMSAIDSFTKRGTVRIPGNSLPWQRILPLGIVGGMVPCPDALAILLMAVYVGKTVLGISIVFTFSIGLALALMLVGSAVVFSKTLYGGGKKFAKAETVLPYISSAVLICIGMSMVFINRR